MTPEEADELFGELWSVSDQLFDDLSALSYRTYQDVGCDFLIDENGNTSLVAIWFFSPEYAPVRGIKVGDSLESVLFKFSADDVVSVKNQRAHRMFIDSDLKVLNNTIDTYNATNVICRDFHTPTGRIIFYFDEDLLLDSMQVYLTH